MPLSEMGTITLKYRVLDECAQRHHSHTHSPTNKINIYSFVFINLKTNLNRFVSTLLDVPFLLLSLVPFPSYPSKIIHVTSIRINRANASFPFSKALKILLWLLRLHFFLSSLSIPLTLSISVALSLFVSSGLSFFFMANIYHWKWYAVLRVTLGELVHSDVLIILHDLHGQKYDWFPDDIWKFFKTVL